MQKPQQLAEVYERSNIPLYLQVASILRRRIEQGQWKLGDRISTIPELEREFGVARVTVRLAVDELSKEGLVSRQQGRGTFVVKGIEEKRWLRLEVTLSSLLKIIEDNIPQFIDVASPPSPRIGMNDGELADDYVYLKSVQFKDDEPFGVVGVHVAKSVYDMDPKGFQSRTALAVLAELGNININHAHQEMVISAADMESARLLNLAVNAPTAEAHCVVTDQQNVAIYVAEIIYRGDSIRFDIELLPKFNKANGK